MTAPIWARAGTRVHDEVMAFLAGEDILHDREIFIFDIEATSAHVRGLARIGALEEVDAECVVDALNVLAEEFKAGEFVLDSRFEDGHSAIESWLCDRIGEIGRRVHLGRSRNDQALVAVRLKTRSALAEIRASVLATAEAALIIADENAHVAMPGYTHLQRAVPSTIGLWMASFAEAFLDDAELLDFTLSWIDRCPLGTAAGYGVNLPLDREGVADDLGFSHLQINPMAAQASRGKHELQALAAIWQPLQTLRRLGWDLTLFASSEFGFVKMPQDLTTGSSIMPNKRNPDVAEIFRANAAVVAGAMSEIQQVISLPSGYHRDLQLTKGPLLRGLTAGQASLALAPTMISGLVFDEANLRAAIDAPMYATDEAVEMTSSGMPFRDAYRQLADHGVWNANRTPEQSARARVSLGACADLRLDQLRARLADQLALRNQCAPSE